MTITAPTADAEILFDIDVNSHCIYMSERAKKVFGDHEGEHIHGVFSEWPEVLEHFKRCQRSCEALTFEVSGRHHWDMQPMMDVEGHFNGAILTVELIDTTTGPQAPISLAPSIWRYDPDTTLLSLHPDLARVLGLQATSMALSAFAERYKPQADILAAHLDDILRGKCVLFSCELSLLDSANGGRHLLMRGQASDVDRMGNVLGINGTVEDIGDQQQAVMERQLDENALIRTQKMQSIADLVRGIAHDFNNILSSVIGYTELALMESSELVPASPRMVTYLQEVFQGGKRARELVAKLQTFSRSDDAKPQNLDLMQEVRDLVKMLRASLPSSIAIRVDIDDNLSEIYIDKILLQQIVTNVVLNARDAMDDVGTIFIRGHQRIVKQARCDACHADFSGEFVELSIEDTGSGVPADIMEKIFEPYATSKAMGSGMGLAVVHGILHRHNAHVRVDAIDHDGSEFRFFFEPAGVAHARPDKAPLQVQPGAGNGTCHVLVIDDEVSLVYYLRELLLKRGYGVSIASDSFEAWDMFSANPDKFDLVVTDQTMPGMSGVQLASKMLTLRADLPIILCTGYSDIVEENNVRDSGIRGFMAKPVDSRELLRNIDALLLESQQTKSE